MTTRDVRLDTFRGIFLVLMTVDHIGGKVTAFTYEPFGFVSAAAGFVMLSAYLYAYTASTKQPLGPSLWRQSLVRAAKLYRYHVLVFALLLLLILVSPLHRGYLAHQFLPGNIGPMASMLYGAVLLHQPTLMHLLPMYLIFTLLSPLVLLAFHRGLHLPVLVLSLSLWAWGQFYDPLEWLVAASDSGALAGDFNLLAWQVLWVSGLYIGFVHGVEKRTALFHSPMSFWLAGIAVVGFMLAKQDVLNMPGQMEFYVEKSDMRALRLANIFCQVVVFCKLVQFLPKDRGLPWLRFIGKYGLQVYCFHVLLVAFLEPVSWRIGMHFSYPAELAFMAAVVASLSIPALLYRAYELQVRRAGARTWPNRLRAVDGVARTLFKPRRKADATRQD